MKLLQSDHALHVGSIPLTCLSLLPLLVCLQFVLPTDSPHLAKSAFAMALSPMLWAQHKPDRFDSWSAGIVLLQASQQCTRMSLQYGALAIASEHWSLCCSSRVWREHGACCSSCLASPDPAARRLIARRSKLRSARNIRWQ